MKHPLIDYANAIVRIDNDLAVETIIERKHLQYSLERQLSYFRLIPAESFEGKKEIKYQYSDNNCTNGLKKLPDYGIFLSPNVIAEDGSANNTWKYSQILLKELQIEKAKSFDALLSITAISGDYMKFSDLGGVGKTTQKLTKEEAVLSMITLTTPDKPSLQYRINKGVGKQPELFNTCIIPELPLNKLIDFVRLYKDIASQKLMADIFVGNVEAIESKDKVTYKPYRPKIRNGNFPNPPQSSALGSIALLGSIGEFAKESEYSEKAKNVLQSLKGATLYIIKYGDAHPFSYNHFVIELAEKGNLKTIIDSIYHSELFKNGKRNRKDLKNKEKDDSINHYQKFDLFTARFLQLFNSAAFKDFLAFRAEYPYQVELLFNTYFIKMEKIDKDIVVSAKHLGKWLNDVAYFSAQENVDVKKEHPEYKEKLRKEKAKILASLESTALSVKDGKGDELIARVVTIASRLSYQDAPNEAELFLEKTASGELSVDQARNLIIVFSRLMKNFNANSNESSDNSDDAEELNEIEDLSNI